LVELNFLQDAPVGQQTVWHGTIPMASQLKRNTFAHHFHWPSYVVQEFQYATTVCIFSQDVTKLALADQPAEVRCGGCQWPDFTSAFGHS
jgi:hypothetical protein